MSDIPPIELAKQYLLPAEFRLRSSEIKLMDDVRPGILENVESHVEGFRRIRGLNESEGSSEDSNEKAFFYVFFYQIGIRVVPDDDEFKTQFPDVESLLEIRADFDCEYISDIQVPKEALAAFMEDNVGFNLWPYWREYVQSTLSRIGAPNQFIKVPFYSAQARAELE